MGNSFPSPSSQLSPLDFFSLPLTPYRRSSDKYHIDGRVVTLRLSSADGRFLFPSYLFLFRFCFRVSLSSSRQPPRLSFLLPQTDPTLCIARALASSAAGYDDRCSR